MAGVLLQAGSERVMGREAWMLIHEASFLAMGKMGEVTDTVEWVKRLCERITNIFADKAATKTGKSPKAIKAFIKKNWTRKDWWISAEEALEYGFCDRVD
jgi:ATP-dependent protease ClpP protease subunit